MRRAGCSDSFTRACSSTHSLAWRSSCWWLRQISGIVRRDEVAVQHVQRTMYYARLVWLAYWLARKKLEVDRLPYVAGEPLSCGFGRLSKKSIGSSTTLVAFPQLSWMRLAPGRGTELAVVLSCVPFVRLRARWFHEGPSQSSGVKSP